MQTMNKHNLFAVIVTVIVALCAVSCKDNGRTTVTASGAIYEMLLVIDGQYQQSSATDTVRSVMEADMPCMPQVEPYFNMMVAPTAVFDDALKSTRNILLVDINPERYTQTKAVYKTDVWAHPQAMCRIQAPDKDAFIHYFSIHGTAIRSWFVQQEIERQGRFYRNYQTTLTREAVQKHFECDIRIPADYTLVADTAYNTDYGRVELVWCVNNGGSLRRDLLLWSYPYRDTATFTPDFLLDRRDDIVRRHVRGQIDGSFAGTEYKHIPPQFAEIAINKSYCAELRGLWKLYGGEAMGGPFVQHTRLDEINQRIITAEVFIFAPGQKKRNALRQAEAILYTLQLPQEMNALKEVQVTASNN